MIRSQEHYLSISKFDLVRKQKCKVSHCITKLTLFKVKIPLNITTAHRAFTKSLNYTFEGVRRKRILVSVLLGLEALTTQKASAKIVQEKKRAKVLQHFISYIFVTLRHKNLYNFLDLWVQEILSKVKALPLRLKKTNNPHFSIYQLLSIKHLHNFLTTFELIPGLQVNPQIRTKEDLLLLSLYQVPFRL